MQHLYLLTIIPDPNCCIKMAALKWLHQNYCIKKIVQEGRLACNFFDINVSNVLSEAEAAWAKKKRCKNEGSNEPSRA